MLSCCVKARCISWRSAGVSLRSSACSQALCQAICTPLGVLSHCGAWVPWCGVPKVMIFATFSLPCTRSQERMATGFYLGTLLIVLSVLIHPLVARLMKAKEPEQAAAISV